MLWLISALVLAVGCGPETYDEQPSGEVSIAYLWSLCRSGSVSVTRDLSIRGRVVATDKMGEVEHRIVVDDGTAGIELHVESRNADAIVPLYAEADILCSGLYLGRDGDHLVLGQKPTGEYVVDRLTDERLRLYVRAITTPETPPMPLRRTIAQLTPYDILRYVRIDSLCFVEAGRSWLDYDSLGIVQHSVRHLTDGCDTLPVRVHPSTIYGPEPLPGGKLNCWGIVESHRDTLALRIINKQAVAQ